jgi:hypothetical protein
MRKPNRKPNRPRTICQVCRHSERGSIDAALLRKVPIRQIGQDYGIPKSSMHRHWQNHVSPAVVERFEKRQEVRGLTPLDQALDLLLHSQGVLSSTDNRLSLPKTQSATRSGLFMRASKDRKTC